MPASRIAPTVIWPGGGVFAWQPTCHLCVWAWFGGRFKLKFANAACREHAPLLKAGT